MSKTKNKKEVRHTLIAEVSHDLKTVNFVLSGAHLASCYPEKSKTTMTSNVYRYMAGDIKSFNGKRFYFPIEITGEFITPKAISELTERARDIARAKKESLENKGKALVG